MKTTIVMAGLALCAGMVRGEQVVFFQAARAGAEAWSWGGAKVKAAGTELRVVEANPEADFGDAFVSDAFPYFSGGEVELSVAAVESGTYTLQVLGFKGDAHRSTADVVKDVGTAGTHRIPLPAQGLAADTQSIMLKLWVGGAEGAAMRIKDLVYRATIPSEGAVVDDRFQDSALWTVEAGRVTATPGPAGMQFQLAGSHTFGPAAFSRRLPVGASEILLHVVSTQGPVTIQLDVFDASGSHLGAIDVLKNVVAGWHRADLGGVTWPTGAATCGIKLWFGGAAGASTVLDRILLIKR